MEREAFVPAVVNVGFEGRRFQSYGSKDKNFVCIINYYKCTVVSVY